MLTQVLLIGVAAALLAGCRVTVDQQVTVRPDGSADVAVITLFPAWVWEQIQTDPAFDLTALEEQLRERYPHASLRVEAVSGEKEAGLRVRATAASVEEAVRLLTAPAESDSQPLLSQLSIRREGGLAGHRYRIEARSDPTTVTQALTSFVDLGTLSADQIRQAFGSMLTVRLAVTLPAPIAAVDGPGAELSDDRRTVRWTIPLDESATLQATSVSVRPPALWAGAGLAAVVLVGSVAVAVRRRAAAF